MFKEDGNVLHFQQPRGELACCRLFVFRVGFRDTCLKSCCTRLVQLYLRSAGTCAAQCDTASNPLARNGHLCLSWLSVRSKDTRLDKAAVGYMILRPKEHGKRRRNLATRLRAMIVPAVLALQRTVGHAHSGGLTMSCHRGSM